MVDASQLTISTQPRHHNARWGGWASPATPPTGPGDDVRATFLRDVDHGGDPAQSARVAQRLADFVGASQKSIHTAVYDFRLQGSELAGPVVSALKQAAERGVDVRIAYDRGKPPAQTTEAFATLGADPAPVGTHEWLHEQFADTPVALAGITAPSGNLMHHKYVVRDAHTPSGAVWTGSTNFTDAAWSRQENNIVELRSARLAATYDLDFLELWANGDIANTGADDDGEAQLGPVAVSYAFGPGRGPSIDARLATLLSTATHHVSVASMVLTSHIILGALADVVARGVSLSGVYDGGQMQGVLTGWAKSEGGRASAAVFNHIASHLTAKPSAPYTPDGPHDFMHNKLIVIDGWTVATGSHNLSGNARANAENALLLRSGDVAHQYEDYVDQLVAAYR